jgi:hypothetical protein
MPGRIATRAQGKRATDNLYIGCWGDVAERMPQGN